MPLPALALAAAQMGLNTVQNIGGGMIQEHFNKKENQRNLDYYRMQRNDALSDYQRDVDYNAPSAQIDRLTKAGLSPHTIQGSSALTSSPQSRGASIAPAAKVNVGNNRAVDYMSMQQGLEQLKLLKLQQAKLVADTENVNADTQTKKLGYSADAQSFDADGTSVINKRKLYELEQMLSNLDKTKNEGHYTAQRTETERNNTRSSRANADIAEIEKMFRSSMLQGRSDLMQSQIRKYMLENRGSEIDLKYQDQNAANRAKLLQMETQMLDALPPAIRYFVEKIGGTGMVSSIFGSIMKRSRPTTINKNFHRHQTEVHNYPDGF